MNKIGFLSALAALTVLGLLGFLKKVLTHIREPQAGPTGQVVGHNEVVQGWPTGPIRPPVATTSARYHGPKSGQMSHSTPLPPDVLNRIMQDARYEYLSEDKICYGELDGFQGVYGTGNTQIEAADDLASALQEWIAHRQTRGLSIPDRARVVS